jgi:hypothetical protein
MRFLFNAMAPKPEEDGSPFQGIPTAIYLDNGPVAKSTVFKRVMESLGVEILAHMPAGSDGRRTTARNGGRQRRLDEPSWTTPEALAATYGDGRKTRMAAREPSNPARAAT